jgi:predicted phosphodiesterase
MPKGSKVRYLVLSDIHSNLAAFEAVLADAGEYDQIWCLGDVIGYGPQPNECIELLKSLPHICVAGNHDWAAIDRLDVSAFNPYALRACLWTREQLTADNWEFIENLPETLVDGHFTIVHGSPRHPVWEYITDSRIATINLAHFDTSYCLFGHTHRPVLYIDDVATGTCEGFLMPLRDPVPIPEERLLLNPGGVGQPRDSDPRASYALIDLGENTVELRRVPYAIKDTQELMISLGLPLQLAKRLEVGW